MKQQDCVSPCTDISLEKHSSPQLRFNLVGRAQYKPTNPLGWRHWESITHKATVFFLSGTIFNPGQHFIVRVGSVVEVELLFNFSMLDGDPVIGSLLCGHVALV